MSFISRLFFNKTQEKPPSEDYKESSSDVIQVRSSAEDRAGTAKRNKTPGSGFWRRKWKLPFKSRTASLPKQMQADGNTTDKAESSIGSPPSEPAAAHSETNAYGAELDELRPPYPIGDRHDRIEAWRQEGARHPPPVGPLSPSAESLSLSPTMLPGENGSDRPSLNNSPSISPAPSDAVIPVTDPPVKKTDFNKKVAAGTAMLVPRQVFQKIGSTKIDLGDANDPLGQLAISTLLGNGSQKQRSLLATNEHGGVYIPRENRDEARQRMGRLLDAFDSGSAVQVFGEAFDLNDKANLWMLELLESKKLVQLDGNGRIRKFSQDNKVRAQALLAKELTRRRSIPDAVKERDQLVNESITLALTGISPAAIKADLDQQAEAAAAQENASPETRSKEEQNAEIFNQHLKNSHFQ